MSQHEFDFNKPLPRQPVAASGEVVDRVKKLLRMKNGGTNAEVETALRMAQRLADEYNINLTELDLAEQSPLTMIVQRRTPTARRITNEAHFASNIIKRFFNVDTVFSERFDAVRCDVVGELVIVGTAVDVEVAEYVFAFLQTHFQLCWRRRPKRIRDRRSFMRGVFTGLYEKLETEGFSPAPLGSLRAALTVSRDAYIKKHFPKLTTTTVKRGKTSVAASSVGYHFGRNTNIRPGVNGGCGSNNPMALSDRVPQLANK